MRHTVELSADGTALVIRFPYRPHIVAAVRDLPGRRWHPTEKEWRVPTEHAGECVRGLEGFGFEFAEEVIRLAGGGATADDSTPPLPFGDATDPVPRGGFLDGLTEDATASHPAPAAQPASQGADQGIRIAELNRRVVAALRGAFPGTLWVIGEVVDHDRRKGKRFLMFKLVDKPSPTADPDAEVDVVMFPETRTGVERRLEAAGLTLQDGVEIRAEARVDLWEKAGRFRLVLEDIDPAFTLGNMQLSRDQILRSLREKGLDRLQPALAIPELPLRIGVLSSPDADGYHDFLRTLQQAERGFRVTLHPTNVQGERMQQQMLAGLRWFAENSADFDVLCILRGGGSRTDLAWFDNQEIAEAVAKHPVPILCGIGHQRDRSVLDEIARSEKTPTAVAGRIVEWVEAAEDHTARQTVRLQGLVDQRLVQSRQRLTQRADRLRQATHQCLAREREALAGAGAQLRWASRGKLAGARTALAQALQRIASGCARHTAARRDRLAAARQRLARTAPRRIADAHLQLRNLDTRLRLLDPRHVVQRGYALLHDDAGGLITSTAQLGIGDGIQVHLRDGEVHGRVDRIAPRAPEAPDHPPNPKP